MGKTRRSDQESREISGKRSVHVKLVSDLIFMSICLIQAFV